MLIETLGILAAHYPTDADLQRDGRGSSAYLHVVSEALKHGFADRARFLGDTDFVSVDLPHLTSPAYHAELARRIKPNAVLPRDAYGTLGAPPAVHKDGGTTHLSVIDADGNAVALTSTVNLGFGAHLVAGKTGHRPQRPDGRFLAHPRRPQRLRPDRQRAERGGAEEAPAVVDDADDRRRRRTGR